MNRCRRCGRFIPKGRQKYCTLDHSIAAAIDASRQMRERRGPVYGSVSVGSWWASKPLNGKRTRPDS